MILETLSAMRDIGRLHDIASILIKYGFGDLVRRLGLEPALEKAGRVLNWNQFELLLKLEPPERVRRALEEMGPTFIKFGQILATRVDLFGPEWIEEFEKLHDRVPPLPFELLRSQIEEDLGCSVDEAFLNFDTTAIAAASIAQVHKAILKDGRAIILKIRRPGIRSTIEADIRLLERLISIIEHEIPDTRHFHPQEVLRNFKVSLRNELDLLSEARNTERAANNFKNNTNILVPKIFWQYSCERMIVQEHMEGIPGHDISRLDNLGFDRKNLAQLGADAVLKMVLIDGFFHADPHPGNFIFVYPNKLAFIDFGMVGTLSELRRDQIIEMLNSIVARDASNMVEVLLDWTDEAPNSTERLVSEVSMFVDKYHGVALKQLRLVNILGEMTALIRDNRLILPADLTMLFKTLITLEGMGRQIDPDFDIVTQIGPLLVQATMARHSPEVMVARAQRSAGNLISVLLAAPQDLRRLMRRIRAGTIKVSVDIRDLARFGSIVDRAASRLTIGMVTASLIIGSSIVMTVSGGPKLFGLPALGVLGFITAGVGASWLMMSIWKTSRLEENNEP